jgi:glutamate 5-kinase
MRIVIKVGSAVLTEKGKLHIERMRDLVYLIADLMYKYEVILVSSGAVAAGYTRLKLDKKDIASKQALAAIGQPLLMAKYKRFFREYGLLISQLLITESDLDSRKRTSHAKQAVDALLKNRVIPIINENDVVGTEELVFGDNDQLSAHVCHRFDADMLIILSDIEGFYDKDPSKHKDAKMQKFISHIPKCKLKAKHNPNNEFATGGIVTKLLAAKYLLDNDKKMFLTSGFNLKYVKSFLLDNKHTKGTLFSK